MIEKVNLMQSGEIHQLGTPQEIYDNPTNMFVAGFIGTPKMNFFQMTVKSENENIYLCCDDFQMEPPQYKEKLLPYINKKIMLGIRPEDILTTRIGEHQQKLTCVLKRYEHLGNKVQLYADFNGSTLNITAPVTVRAKIEQEMVVYMDKRKVHLFDAETEMRL